MTTKFLLYIMLLLFAISGCVSKRKLVYLGNVQLNDSIAVTKPQNMEIKITPGENLYLTFFNANPEINNLLNGGRNMQNSQASANGANLYFNSFGVNDSGIVDVPIIGKVNLGGLTLDQARNVIIEKINLVFSETYVNLRLSERTFTVLGEFKATGTYAFNKDKLTLFSAIGMAGDITEYGNRRHVKIIRQVNDKALATYVDLTSPDFISSPYYYVQHNDVIYIEPLTAKTFQTRTFPITGILSIFTSLLVIYGFFR